MRVIRQLLVRRNRILDRDEKAVINGTDRERDEEAASLEGLTFERTLPLFIIKQCNCQNDVSHCYLECDTDITQTSHSP